ncbi:GNAT family N-acetyltransferase [Deinococcus yavapaiensis]|uniref:N-acetyltransferase domain-containing protein n=1 Tax=Deinococcus yavapaiensis KR-236 TaxID=694435 RepID=A0A318SAW0_9DEIO|nr:GNAT family N-acetyltransferase [Deinococcus yavapaiensis]PYE53749.1 hypothetical protein DES52_1077 [Deinococcus yavapaiensis KR-236]
MSNASTSDFGHPSCSSRSQRDVHAIAQRRADVYAAFFRGYLSFPSDARERLGVEAIEFGAGVLELVRSLPYPSFNLVRDFGVTAPATSEDIDALLHVVREENVVGWGLPLDPRVQPANLAEALRARGIGEVFRLSALHVSAEELRRRGDVTRPSDLDVREVEEADVDQAAAFVAEQFGMPGPLGDLLRLGVRHLGWRCYAVLDEGEFSSVGFLTVEGSAALLHSTVTRSDARGRGGQTALIARRIRDALALGCEDFFVDVLAGPDNPSRRNLERIGFESAYEVPLYMAEPQS